MSSLPPTVPEKYAGYYRALRQGGASQHEALEAVEELEREIRALDARLCPGCNAEITRTLDDRQVGSTPCSCDCCGHSELAHVCSGPVLACTCMVAGCTCTDFVWPKGPAAVWFNYRCSNCKYMADRKEPA